MILIGIDDTDTLDSPGTNQIARKIARRLLPRWQCRWVVRHQLFFDPRVPYTSKNGSASLWLESGDRDESLVTICREVLRENFVEGSDPGLCIATNVPQAIRNFGLQCQSTLQTQPAARELASRHHLHLEGLGGTEDGIIGALAAVGLAVGGNDGRIVYQGDWPEDLRGIQTVEQLHRRNVTVWNAETQTEITDGQVDLVKKLRPNVRDHAAVLYVEPTTTAGCYTALKFP